MKGFIVEKGSRYDCFLILFVEFEKLFIIFLKFCRKVGIYLRKVFGLDFVVGNICIKLLKLFFLI